MSPAAPTANAAPILLTALPIVDPCSSFTTDRRGAYPSYASFLWLVVCMFNGERTERE
jgi:hypothetical protein